MLRFRLFGIPFAVAPVFWFFSAILGSNIAQRGGLLLLAVWVACVFVSIVVHELGHALTARRYGLRPAVTLTGMGGLTSFAGVYLTRAQHVAVTLAGPAAGFIFYLIVRACDPRLGPPTAGDFADPGSTGSLVLAFALDNLVFINLWWTIYNLLPVLPLDGGQILRDVLGPRLLGTTRYIGTVCGAAVCVYAALHGQIWMAVLFGYLAFANLRGITNTLQGGVSQTGGR